MWKIFLTGTCKEVDKLLNLELLKYTGFKNGSDAVWLFNAKIPNKVLMLHFSILSPFDNYNGYYVYLFR